MLTATCRATPTLTICATLAVLASLVASTVSCTTEDCSSVAPGDRSISGTVAFRFDDSEVRADLSDPLQHDSLTQQWEPISGPRLQFRWSIGAESVRSHVYIDVDGIPGIGTFALGDLAARACGCPHEASDFELGAEVRCVFYDDAGNERTEAAMCEALEGEIVIRELDRLCSEDSASVCAPRQDFDVHVPERSGARFSADVHVQWFDTIDEQTCTGSSIGPVA